MNHTHQESRKCDRGGAEVDRSIHECLAAVESMFLFGWFEKHKPREDCFV